MTKNTDHCRHPCGRTHHACRCWAAGPGNRWRYEQRTRRQRAPRQPQLVSITTSPGTEGTGDVLGAAKQSAARDERVIQHDAMRIAIGCDNLSYGASGCTY
jgi:hypothetical protein